jgi:hypothetical protein
MWGVPDEVDAATDLMAAVSPELPMLRYARTSGFQGVAKNLPKLNGVSPRGCGTRIFSDFGLRTASAKNDRLCIGSFGAAQHRVVFNWKMKVGCEARSTTAVNVALAYSFMSDLLCRV